MPYALSPQPRILDSLSHARLAVELQLISPNSKPLNPMHRNPKPKTQNHKRQEFLVPGLGFKLGFPKPSILEP
jgi:hypothetical protein